MISYFSRRKRLESSVEELQKSVAEIKEIVNALAKSRNENEEGAPFSQILDEWQNGKEEQNG